MKYLIAMLFYNITIGCDVMYRARYKEYEGEFKKGNGMQADRDFKHDKLKVIGIYIVPRKPNRLFFVPCNIFRMGIIVQNPSEQASGAKDYCGINAVVPFDNF